MQLVVLLNHGAAAAAKGSKAVARNIAGDRVLFPYGFSGGALRHPTAAVQCSECVPYCPAPNAAAPHDALMRPPKLLDIETVEHCGAKGTKAASLDTARRSTAAAKASLPLWHFFTIIQSGTLYDVRLIRHIAPAAVCVGHGDMPSIQSTRRRRTRFGATAVARLCARLRPNSAHY